MTTETNRGFGLVQRQWTATLLTLAVTATATLGQPLPPEEDEPARRGEPAEETPAALRPPREDTPEQRAQRIREAIANRRGTPVIGEVRQPPGQPVPVEQQTPEQAAGEGGPEAQLVPGTEQPEIDGDEMVELSAFSEGVDLKVLIAQVAQILGINVSVAPGLEGKTVELNAPIAIKRENLLGLLDALLEQHGFAITLDPSGFYVIRERSALPLTTGDLATTKIIDTPNVRPSALQRPIQQVLGTPGEGTGAGSVSFIDELGVIVVTDSPRNIARVEDIVETILERKNQMQLFRIDLEYVAAPVARERALALAGAVAADPTGQSRFNASVRNRNINPNEQGGGIGFLGSGSTLDNIGDRLGVSPTGNSLVFNGVQAEVDAVRRLIEMIDVPETLEPRRYQAGQSARQIADLANQRGLGEVTLIEDVLSTTNQNRFGGAQPNVQNPFQTTEPSLGGGSVMVVDERKGLIIYYGTPAQQQEMAALLDEMDTESDRVVIRSYRLNNAAAADVQAVIESLLTGQTQSTNPLLPTGQQPTRQIQQSPSAGNQFDGGDDEIGEFDRDRAFIVADEANNQVIVKAPKKQQDDFAKLIRNLDLRRPQVYIEAQIVSVSKSEDFQLAVETQISAGEAQFQTNFGLTNPGDTFVTPRTVNTGLAGFTAAVIQSQYLPFVINAIQTDTDARILSTPQLLVNDNEEASIVSLEEQPTTTTTIGQTSDQVAFDGFQEAGTRLNVTPSIADAGFLRLEYEVELSNFVGAGSNGVPAPRQTRTVNGLVTIPSDATIVVGGITVNNLRETVAKIPLLGDIPLLGLLFQDRGKITDESLLYIFITPRIMTDPNFRDIKLFTEGPQGESNLDPTLPPMEPEAIEFIQPRPIRKPAEDDSAALGMERLPANDPRLASGARR